ncbi:MAG: hypothetical protein SFV15_20920 [Polyangiaceae bacterium]|nr:hypothetical protein [Polyangiaceae bacterium]
MTSQINFRALVSTQALCLSALLLGACGSATTTQRVVETPTGKSVEYGAPKNTGYNVEIFPEQDALRVTVYERSLCDKIPVETTERVQETLRNGEVVERAPLGKGQRAGEPKGTVPCGQRYASDALVSLKVGDAVYPIGKTNAEGQVGVVLSERLKTDVYGAPEREVVVLVKAPGAMETMEAGKVTASVFQEHEHMVAALAQSLGALLGKAELTAADITASYEAYAKLRAIAPEDARFQGLSARFWEVFTGRKRDEAAANLKKNLKALEEAKGVLSSASLATIPLFAQIAANAQAFDARAAEWSEFEVLTGLRAAPEICTAGFAWASLETRSAPLRFAGSYLRGVYGDDYAVSLNGLCKTLKR